VPCFNEEKRLNPVVYIRFVEKYPLIMILFVNDGSSDGTEEVIRTLLRKNKANLPLLNLAKNMGKGEAVRRGIIEALKSSPDFVGYWDADLSTPLEALFNFIKIFKENPNITLVMGARVKLLGRDILRKCWRHYLGRLFATFADIVLGLGIYDTQCGAKLFRVTEDTRELFAFPFISRWIFDVEIIARMIYFNRYRIGPGLSESIYEYPLFKWHEAKDSKINISAFLIAAYELFRIYASTDRIQNKNRKKKKSINENNI